MRTISLFATFISVLAIIIPIHHQTPKHHPHYVIPEVHHVHKHHQHRRIIATDGQITQFDLCVANRENGEPGSLDYSYIDWDAVNGYYGAYSFLESTWIAAGGGKFAHNANEATPQEQSQVFNEYEPQDPGAWPNTVPPCLEYQ